MAVFCCPFLPFLLFLYTFFSHSFFLFLSSSTSENRVRKPPVSQEHYRRECYISVIIYYCYNKKQREHIVIATLIARHPRLPSVSPCHRILRLVELASSLIIAPELRSKIYSLSRREPRRSVAQCRGADFRDENQK